MAAGSVVTLTTMIILEINAKVQYDGIYANEPIYYGLIASLFAYIVVSLATKPTDPAVREAWDLRVAGAVSEEVPVEGPEDAHSR
jgi:SSS family solute:Na+ symporter